jgi:rhodanese-related sulfurtransferase
MSSYLFNREKPMKNNYQYEHTSAILEKLERKEPINLVDVRTPAEFNDGHARGAILLPLEELSLGSLKARAGISDRKEQTIYLMCQSGFRAEQAADKLSQQGLTNTVVIEGGFSAWRSAGLPVIRKSRVPSLERQTQIALGGLLLLILFKGLLLHPLFYALIGFLALGLIAAGVTARCTLTAILARMPWNQTPA